MLVGTKPKTQVISSRTRRSRVVLSGSLSCPATVWTPAIPAPRSTDERSAGQGQPTPLAGLKAGRPSTLPRPARGIKAVFGVDLVLLHAPSIYDFRKRESMVGPVADVIPSTGQFEMYPIGLTSIAGYLERNAYNVRIVNLAYRMLASRSFDVAAHLRGIKAPVFGIDLHWLPHAQGALAIAELVKREHPEAKVLLGGLSATYYHEELASLPHVDFVLRGDSTEEPARQLLCSLREGLPLEAVQNLTWKRADGTVVVNPMTFVPADLDYVDVPNYRYALRSVFKYRDLRDLVPYLSWLREPTTMVLNARGCTYDCAICGGSRSAYRQLCNRSRPAFRSPERLVSDISTIASFSSAPVFMVHDPRIGGMARARRFFELFAAAGISNELVIELFFPAGDDFFGLIEHCTRAWSMEITIESPNERLRKVNGKFPGPNERVESTLESALAHRCGKLDLFFMVGIPHQTPAEAMETVDYCRHLVERFGADRRLQFYIAPLGPFLDPGSRAFEDPRLGYRKRFNTLEEHRRALEQTDWREVLSFETEAMTRDELVRTTYEVAERLNQLKFDAKLIDQQTFSTVHRHLVRAREVLAALDTARDRSEAERETILHRMHAEVQAANEQSIVGAGELRWTRRSGIHVTRTLLGSLAHALGTELGRGLARFRGRYDLDAYVPGS
jgi:B12-binding domain/radical SAM domain protein